MSVLDNDGNGRTTHGEHEGHEFMMIGCNDGLRRGPCHRVSTTETDVAAHKSMLSPGEP